MEIDQTKDKAIFAVGLMASFLAFSAYKQELSNIYLSIFHHQISLSWLFLIFVTILACSVYFYALQYLRFIFPAIQNAFIFKLISLLATLFYTLGLLFPVLILFFWILSAIPAPTNEHLIIIVLGQIISATTVAVLSLINAVTQLTSRKNKQVEKLEQEKNKFLQEALSLLDGKFYNQVVIESFRVLEVYLREVLLEKFGLYTEGMNTSLVLKAAIKSGVLEKKYEAKVEKLRQRRNFFVHLNTPINRRTAQKNAKESVALLRSILTQE